MNARFPVVCFRDVITLCGCVLLLGVSFAAYGDEGGGTVGIAPMNSGAGAKATRNLPVGEIWVVPAAEFESDGFLPDSRFFPFGGGYFQGGSGAYGCMVAPVYLPNGATIVEFFASVYDNDASAFIEVRLRRVDNFAGGTDTLGSAATTGAGAFAGIQVISESTIDQPVVSYPNYSYYLTVCLASADIRLYSVRIYLDVLFVDGFESGTTGAWTVTNP